MKLGIAKDDNRSEATLTTTIQNINNFEVGENKFSEMTSYVRGLPWKIAVYRCKLTNDKHTLGLYVFCNWDDETEWSCDAKVTLRVLAQKSDVKNKWKVQTYNFNNRGLNYYTGDSTFMGWDEAMNPNNGYITVDNEMTFQVLISADPVVRTNSS